MTLETAKRIWLAVFIWCVLFVLLLAARSYTFRSAIVHDEGVFLYGGMALAAGETPYRDFWDHKPPGITLFHSIPIRLFGYSLLAVRVHEVFWLAISATIFFYLCHAHLSPGFGIVSLLLYCLLVSTKLLIRSGGLTEESALTFYALSYLFALRRRGPLPLNIFLAGLFLGMAAEFRQPFGVSIVFVALCVLWRREDSQVSFKAKVGLLAVLAVGAALPELFCSGYFLLEGVWQEYFEASYLFGFVYVAGRLDPDVLGLKAGFQKHWQILKATGPYLLSPAFAAPFLGWLPRRLRRIGVLMIVAFLCDFVAISLGGRYYEHYYLQAAISSCFLLGLAFQAVYEKVRGVAVAVKNRLSRWAQGAPASVRGVSWRGLPFLPVYWCAVAMVGACVILSAAGVRSYVKSYRQALEEKGRPVGEVATQEAIGKAIRVLTEPHERILLIGASPTSVYFQGQRLAGSRYYHMSPFFRKAFAESVRERHRERLISDLRTRKPVLVILAREERQIYFAGMKVVEDSAAGKEVVAYLEENYVPFESRELCPLSKIRRELGWSWYRAVCSFLIREDKMEEVRERLAKEIGGP